MIKYFAIISLCLALTSAKIDYSCHYILDPEARANNEWCQQNCFNDAGQVAPSCIPNSNPDQVCSCEGPSPQYTCDETTYQCVPSRNGIPLKDCNEKCQKPFSHWRCDPQTKKCVGDDEHGAYTSHKGCDYVCDQGYFKTTLNFSDVGENYQWVEIVVTRDDNKTKSPNKGGKVVKRFQIQKSNPDAPTLQANANLTFWYQNHDGEYSISQNHYSCWAEKGCVWNVAAQAPDSTFGKWSFSWPQGSKSWPYTHIVLTLPNTNTSVYKCAIDGTEVCSEWWARKFDQYFQTEQGELVLWMTGFYAPKGGKYKCKPNNSLAFGNTAKQNLTSNRQHPYPVYTLLPFANAFG